MAVLIGCAEMTGCQGGSDSYPKPKPEVRIATLAGRSWLEPLARIYGSNLRDVNFSMVESSGAVSNMDFIQNERAEVALAQSDIAYFAFTRGTETDQRPHSKLRGMAVL